jgi:hypothetical protein
LKRLFFRDTGKKMPICQNSKKGTGDPKIARFLPKEEKNGLREPLG